MGGNYSTDECQPKVLENIKDDVKESFQQLSLESESRLDREGNKKNQYLQGSKIEQGSTRRQQKDRRKLRKKRRTTGVVHLDTSKDTTREDDMNEDMNRVTKKNTEQNEIVGKMNILTNSLVFKISIQIQKERELGRTLRMTNTDTDISKWGMMNR